jgi:hypothetical protein
MPREASEAMRTLIFTAARYPDLPEMCDLIHIFTDRYGACIEPFVCSEVHMAFSPFMFKMLLLLHHAD